MDYNNIAETIIAMKNADFKLRDALVKNGLLAKGYNRQMADLHNKNAETLNQIIDQIGYPTTDKVGIEASESAWVIIQHAIGKPKFMKKCVNLLEKAVFENKASEINLAYLTDRIAVLEGNPQWYGTQFDWDENGVLSPNIYDNISKVNQRRKQIGLNTIEEQTIMIRERAKNENQTLPENLKERTDEVEKWRRETGWIE